MVLKLYSPKFKKIVAAFRGMHVSPAKHSFGKCDRKVWQKSVTDGQTDGRTDGRRTKCVAMLRRRHKKYIHIIFMSTALLLWVNVMLDFSCVDFAKLRGIWSNWKMLNKNLCVQLDFEPKTFCFADGHLRTLNYQIKIILNQRCHSYQMRDFCKLML